MTIKYLLDKRKYLIEKLESHEHCLRVATTYYGEHDPFDIPEVLCDRCQSKPVLIKTKTSPVKFFIKCPKCKHQTINQKTHTWRAWLDWAAINLGSIDYKTFPLFGIQKLTPKEAQHRVFGIRRDLEIKKKIAGIENQLGKRNRVNIVDEEEIHRFEAYLQWSILALAVIKNKLKLLKEYRELYSRRNK